MKVARKLLVAGGASLVLAGGTLALPLTPSVGATNGKGSHHGPIKKPDSYVLKEDANATYNVKTEISPDHHTLWTTVTNKTQAALDPTVTFNGKEGVSYGSKPIDPGKTKKYVHFFSGNNFAVDIAVTAEGADPFTSSATVNLPEPVSFQTTATDPTNRTVTGTLVNNTSEPQTVYVKNHKKKKDVQVETLAANETRSITLSSPYKEKSDDRNRNNGEQHKDLNYLRLSIATKAGYNGAYIIPLDVKATDPVPFQ